MLFQYFNSLYGLILTLCLWGVFLYCIFYTLVVASRLPFKSDSRIYTENFLARVNLLLLFLFIVLAAFAFFYVDPFYASVFPISDSIEYAVAAQRIALYGSFDIVLDGVSYPPRYPIAFPLYLLAPLYYLCGLEIGNAVYLVSFFSVIGVCAAFLLGKMLSCAWGALFAALALMTIPGYRYFGTQVMTDVPFAAMILVALLLFVHLSSADEIKRQEYTVAGFIVALSYVIRPFGAWLLLPFIYCLWKYRRERYCKSSFVLLIAPLVFFIWITLLYNAYAFGEAFRTGYNFWLPVPYDDFSLTFSISYFWSNLEVLFYDSGFLMLLLFVIIAALLWKRVLRRGLERRQLFISSIYFLCIVGLPIVLFHLFYFYSASRFYLGIRVLLTVVLGGAAGVLFHKDRSSHFLPLIFSAIICAGILVYKWGIELEVPNNRSIADAFAESLPDNAVIISKLNPVYLEALVLRDTKRRLIPWSREVEYASKLVSWKKMNDFMPPAKNAFDHQAPGLLNAGAFYPIKRTVLEDQKYISKLIRSKAPVFISIREFSEDELKSLKRQYALVPLQGKIFRLKLL